MVPAAVPSTEESTIWRKARVLLTVHGVVGFTGGESFGDYINEMVNCRFIDSVIWSVPAALF